MVNFSIAGVGGIRSLDLPRVLWLTGTRELHPALPRAFQSVPVEAQGSLQIMELVRGVKVGLCGIQEGFLGMFACL